MKKKNSTIKLKVAATKASAAPPVGQVLGQYGLKIMDFCKDFNNQTQNYKDTTLIPVKINVYKDKTFDFKTTLPSNMFFIKKKANIIKGSNNPKHLTVKTLTLNDIYIIAQLKKQDDQLSQIPIESLCKTLISTAKSMGISVIK